MLLYDVRIEIMDQSKAKVTWEKGRVVVNKPKTRSESKKNKDISAFSQLSTNYPATRSQGKLGQSSSSIQDDALSSHSSTQQTSSPLSKKRKITQKEIKPDESVMKSFELLSTPTKSYKPLRIASNLSSPRVIASSSKDFMISSESPTKSVNSSPSKKDIATLKNKLVTWIFLWIFIQLGRLQSKSTRLNKVLNTMETNRDANAVDRTAAQREQIEDQIIAQIQRIYDNSLVINKTEEEIIQLEAQLCFNKPGIT